MPELPVTLIKGDKLSIETDYRDLLPVNMYAIKREILGAEGYLIQYPGMDQIAAGSGRDRGAVYNERFNNQYRVSGTDLVSISTGYDITVLGTIPGDKQVKLQDFYSFNTQGIIAEGKFFLYDPIDGFREVTDPDLGSPIDGVWIDGYYFMTDGEYLFHTDINDEESIDALKFATAEFMPDPSIGVAKTQDNKVLVFGRYSLEYFINDATEDFAFRRIDSRAQKIGIVATHAKCESKSNYYITGSRKNEALGVYSIGVGSAQKVSNREIDKILAKYKEYELADIRMESREENNITFVLVHLPNEVLCFNEKLATELGLEVSWSLLKYDVQGNIPYRSINGIFDPRRSEWIYGDKRTNVLGKLNNSRSTQYGDMVEWILYTPLVRLETFSINSFEIATIPGQTPYSEDQQDVTVAISLTYNGVTYGSEYWNLYGTPYNYNTRFLVRRLGYVNEWVGFKLRGASTLRVAFGLFRLDYS
jgi:hypothetical protein